MGRLTPLIAGKLLAFDTSPLIYYIEQHPVYGSITDELFEAIHQGNTRGLTSVLTLSEVLVHPLRSGRLDLARQYREILTRSTGISLISVDAEICERAAVLRADHEWIRTPDAIQVATAVRNGAELIITNDDRWRRLTEIQVQVLKDFLQPEP